MMVTCACALQRDGDAHWSARARHAHLRCALHPSITTSANWQSKQPASNLAQALPGSLIPHATFGCDRSGRGDPVVITAATDSATVDVPLAIAVTPAATMLPTALAAQPTDCTPDRTAAAGERRP